MQLHELMDQGDLAAMEDQGYIDVRPHPTLPLAIVNYTKKCAWERKWNAVTTKCRGLIYDYYTMEIVARPFEKFFNYEEVEAGLVEGFDLSHMMDRQVRVSDKMDGSLGIIYPGTEGRYAVATRGSFTSDQAIHATAILRSRYKHVEYMPGVTFLVEIIYPENRVVLDYGSMDDLVLIGAVLNDSGVTCDAIEAERLLVGWNGPVTKTFAAPTLRDALQLPHRDNAEGVVVLFPATGERLKIKQADYVELHKIVTGMSDRKIWEMLSDEAVTLDDIKRPLPEEFHPWVDQVADELHTKMIAMITSAWNEYFDVLYELSQENEHWTRKDFALKVKDSPNRAYLFMQLDNKSLWDVLWKSIRPAAGRSLIQTSEDAD